MIYSFEERLAFSRGTVELTQVDTIRRLLPDCISVEKTSVEEDRRGVDFIATLKGGRQIGIDAKTRDKGVSKYWRHPKKWNSVSIYHNNKEPEVAVEKWSVVPSKTCKEGVVGWTRKPESHAEMILYTFDPSDCEYAWLISFQSLRMAYNRYGQAWEDYLKVKNQDSGRWQSKCIFVPVCYVHKGIMLASQTRIPITDLIGGAA